MSSPLSSPNPLSVPCTAAPRAILCRDRGDELVSRIEGFRDYLHLLARRKLGSNLTAKIGASDLVQETLCVAVQKAKMFRAEGDTPARLRGWLEAILVNQLANIRYRYLGTRKRQLGREVLAPDLADTATSPSTVFRREERHDALRAALQRLPDHYRRVIVWRYWERLGYEAIGRKLGVSTEAARKVGGRALIELRTVIGVGHDPF
jgi:RNA polymerase sigma-70 factor, ECF subfamily